MVSRNIPNAIKEEVRRRCGYTCVLCGNLIWEYEHIVPFAECKEHTAKNITLLCRAHHGEVTAGRLDKDVVRKANQNPYGKRKKFYNSHTLHLNKVKRIKAMSHLIYATDLNCKIIVIKRGSEDCFSIRLDDGWPLVSLVLRDVNGEVVLSIIENEIGFSSDRIQDINFVGKNLEVKNLQNETIFKLTLDQSTLSVKYAEFLFEDMVIVGTEGGITIVNNLLAPNTSYNNVMVGYVGRKESFVIFGVNLEDNNEKSFMRSVFVSPPNNVPIEEMLTVARRSVPIEEISYRGPGFVNVADPLSELIRQGLWSSKKRK